jgi:hypothetical protein
MAPHVSLRRPLIATSFVLASFAGIAAALSFGSDDAARDLESEHGDPPPPAQTEEAALLLRLGLGAETLCAAGVASEDVAGAIDAVFDEIVQKGSTMRELDAAYAAARGDRDSLRRKVRSGLASAEEVQQLAVAKASLATAESNRDAYLDALRGAALATLSAAESADVSQIVANSNWKFPTELLLEDRTEAEWVALRDALAAERIHLKAGETVPSSVATALATARQTTEASTARTNLDTYLAAVQTAWNAGATR